MFTDYLGNPINVGDIIIYPQHAGSSSARIQMARVLEIDEIVKGDRWEGEAYLYSQRNRNDRATKTFPQKSVPTGPGRHDFALVDDPEKAYALKVQRMAFNYRTGQFEAEVEVDWDATEEASPTGKRYDHDHAVYRPVKASRIQNVDRVTVVTSLVP